MQNSWVYMEMQTHTTFAFNVHLFLFQEAMYFKHRNIAREGRTVAQM